MNKILIVDDDDQLRISFVRLLSEEGYRVFAAASAEAGIRMVKEAAPDLVILDVRLPGMSGLDAFKAIHRMEPKLPVIIMTAYGTTETAIEATKMGAYDYVLKPFDIPGILSMIQQALDSGRFMRNPVSLNMLPDRFDRDAMIGSSLSMQNVYKAIGRVAATDATVLVRGDSGTGKELAARAVYQHSLRSEKPFLVINCVAIPETLLESELFGYEKGAFTGAVHRRIGKIEQASGGTVFLDEIGDMPMNLQAKMLRLLQEKCIERLGGRETIPVNVRIIAATNRDLETMIANSQFREDLYYRLKVITIWMPPLHERNEDIDQLADYYLKRYASELGTGNPGITAEARALLRQMPWPGNIRELANTLQKALIFNRGAPLGREDIMEATGRQERRLRSDRADPGEVLRDWVRQLVRDHPPEDLFETCTDRFAAILIEEALNATGGNRSQAARLLGLSRPTLHAKIEKYDLIFETSVKAPIR
jgi:DNA-binding NtrC family response regulator